MRVFLVIMTILLLLIVSLINHCNKIVDDYYKEQKEGCYDRMTKVLLFDHEFATKWCSSY